MRPDDLTGLFCAGGSDNAASDHINVHWWLLNLMFSYKYGEKWSFERSLAKLRPYLDDKLYMVFEDLLETSTWTNPITGKKGY